MGNKFSNNDFDTMDYEFLQVKNRFSNIKFAYKEKVSKQIFYSHLQNDRLEKKNENDERSKEELVAIKSEIENISNSIKDLSETNYHLDCEIAALEEEQLALINEQNERVKENELLNKFDKRNLQLIEVKEEFELLVIEIEEIVNEIKKYQSALDKNSYKELVNEESRISGELKNLKGSIGKMNLESKGNIKDLIYAWYTRLVGIYKTIFGEFTIEEGVGNKSIIKISHEKNKMGVEILLENNLLKDITPLNISKEMVSKFIQYKERCIRLNDPRLIFVFLANGENLI